MVVYDPDLRAIHIREIQVQYPIDESSDIELKSHVIGQKIVMTDMDGIRLINAIPLFQAEEYKDQKRASIVA